MSRYSATMNRATAVFFASMLIFAAGCSDDDAVAPVVPSEVDLLGILCNPLAPEPDSLVTLSVQVAGEGAEATYVWTASGGTFDDGDSQTAEDNKGITVNWRAPATPGAYEVAVVARLGSIERTLNKYILVRRFETYSTGVRYNYYPRSAAGNVYFLGSNVPSTADVFYGYHVYRMGAPSTIVTTSPVVMVSGGEEFEIRNGYIMASVVTYGLEFLRRQSMNVIRFPMASGTYWYPSNNDVGGLNLRNNQHIHPWVSPDMSMVVWQVSVAGDKDDGTHDRVNINYRDGLDDIQRITSSVDSSYYNQAWEYSYYENIKPMFSPALDKVVYFVDSTGTFEPCIIPLAPGGPQLAERRALMVDSQHGIFYYAGITVSERTVFEWNPSSASELLFIDGERRLCLFDVVDESIEILHEGAYEFTLSETGDVAVIGAGGVYVGAIGGALEPVYVKERSSDDLYGVTLSPGASNRRIVFRLVRKGAAVDESFSTMILYSFDEGRWYHATPRIPFGTEPEISDYRWRRVLFEESGDGFIAPVATSDDGGSVKLYRSY